MHKLILQLLAVCSLCCTLPVAAQAPAKNNQSNNGNGQAMLILDASGSMWGQIDSVPKITIAREVVENVLGDWDAQTALGLMAYGHREKGSCEDIETLIQPARLDTAKFSKAVGSLNPKGKTPLTEAVRRAAEALKFTENRATVILVSDGEETCGLDPCAVADSLEKLGVDFTAHVISFDSNDDKLDGMRCLADRTGGRFLKAANARELRDAFSRTVSLATDRQKIVETPAVLSVPAEVPAGSRFDVAWTGPKNRSDRLMIRNAKRIYQYAHVGDKEAQSPASMVAPEEAGLFQVHYETREGKSLGQAELKVVPVLASIKVVSGTALIAGADFSVTWTGPNYTNDDLRVVADPNGGGTPLSRFHVGRPNPTSSASLRAPEKPGEYFVVYKMARGEILARETIRVVAASASIGVPANPIVAGADFSVTWTGPNYMTDDLRVITDPNGGGTPLSRRPLGRPSTSTSPLTLRAPKQPGEYFVVYRMARGTILARGKIKVVAK